MHSLSMQSVNACRTTLSEQPVGTLAVLAGSVRVQPRNVRFYASSVELALSLSLVRRVYRPRRGAMARRLCAVQQRRREALAYRSDNGSPIRGVH